MVFDRREIGRVGDEQGGATLVVVGGVHGNEPAGLIAAIRVLDRLKSVEPRLIRGRFVALAGNLEALNHDDPDVRYIDHDLNRLCKRERFVEPASTSVEHREMFELFDSIEEINNTSASMVVLDLHTTSGPSRPVVAFADSLPARAHAMRLPIPKYLGIEEEIQGLVIDAVSERFACVSYLIEGGQHNDPVSVDVHEAAIWMALDSAGIVSLGDVEIERFIGDDGPAGYLAKASKDRGHIIYDVRHRSPILHEDYDICDGITTGTEVLAGVTVLAMQDGKEVFSPIHGLVFLPNMQKHKRVGDDGFFIVRRVGSGWVRLSAVFRSKGWVHWLVRLMPGVYPKDDGVLLVDGDLACVLRRQVFHLLGYRLLRHDGRDGGTGFLRIINGAKAFFGALCRGPIRGGDGKGPGQEDDRFWIVQRRLLDRAKR